MSLFRCCGLTLLIFLFSLTGLTSDATARWDQQPAKLTLRGSSWNSDSLKVWVFFADKKLANGSLSKAIALPAKTLKRRELRGSLRSNPDKMQWLDREVSSDYETSVLATGARLRQKSRWLNAISVIATPAQLQQIAELDFVTRMQEVARFYQPLPKIEPVAPDRNQSLNKPLGTDVFDYGNSFTQLNLIEVVALHDQGLSGAGVTILSLDTGFLISHEVFLSTHIVGTHDFINGDDDVQDNGQNIAQQVHGTATLSTIGGFKDGTLIGAAYGADFLLAKTEIVAQEIQIEEDNWVAGIEWGEQNGADVATSSLGYDKWYTYSDLDGNTAITTVAADMAASLGVIVVNSVGNDGHEGVPSLNAPADGDSVIAVGAIDLSGRIAGFTSNGPTYDGRIKPDVVAPGVAVFVATRDGNYGTESGTSFSCPLTAGVCALLLEAHPDWDYGKLYGALTGSATRATSPDNVAGYGIVRAAHALDYVPGQAHTTKGIVGFPNPFHPPEESIEFAFELEPAGPIALRIYTVAGEKVFEFDRQAGDPQALSWDGRNSKGEEVAAGVYIAYISGGGLSETYKIFKL